MPVHAFTNNLDTYYHLSLIGGIEPHFIKSIVNQSNTILKIKKKMVASKNSKKSSKYVFIAGVYSASHTDSIQIIST
jgi:pyruvate kinase